jgi:inositol 2-dehydrogenase
MKKKLNVGLIGLGRLGRNYADYLTNRLPAANLVAISDVDKTAIESCASEFAVTKSYHDYRDLVSDKEIDAVVIVTPTSTHKSIIIAAARQKKAVFCEKPLTLSLQEGLEIKQVIADTGIFFHMGFMRRFDKGYAAAKHKIESGKIGTAVVFKSSSRDPYRPSLEYADPRFSGGLFADMGIHDFDLARWFMGDVKSVFGSGGTLAYPEMKEIGDIDNGIVNMTFADGTLGVVDLSRNGVYGYDIRTEILGTKGTIKIGYLRETPIMVMAKEGIYHDTVPYFMERFGDAYVAQLREFIDQVLQDKEPSVTESDGVEALKVSLAAKKSFDENRPVEIREIKAP